MRRIWLGVVLVLAGCDCGGKGGDDGGLPDASTPVVLAWPAGARLEVSAATDSAATLSWPAALGPVAKYRLETDGTAQDVAAPGFNLSGLIVGHHVAVSVVAVGSDGTQTPALRAEASATEPLVVPDGDISTDFCGANAFLQRGAAIPCDQFAVVIGHVRTREGAGVPGMRVSVLNHPEWGEAVSQADGLFALAVAAGRHTVALSSDSFIHLQRNVSGGAGDFIYVPDTVVLRRDSKATVVALPAGGFHAATSQEDADGQRTSSVFIPPGTSAWLRFADAGTSPVTTLTLRATEATVGETGPEAMPGTLPGTTAYTFAADISVDEAVAADALGVGFSGEVAFYSDNFLEYPVGTTVPLGAYDETTGTWESLPSAIVVEIRADGTTSPLVALLPGEQAQLAATFAAGTQLVRSLTTHFSIVDANCSSRCLGSCEPAGDAEVAAREAHCDGECGSLIRVQNRTLSEYVPVAGTGLMLGWHSNRGQLRQPAVNMTLGALDDGGVPQGVSGTLFRLDVAGQTLLDRRLDGGVGDAVTLTWNGKDAFGRRLLGPVKAVSTTGFSFDGVAVSTLDNGEAQYAFGVWPQGAVEMSPTRRGAFITRSRVHLLGDWVPHENLGNLSLDIVHGYSGRQVLHLGNGAEFPVVTGGEVTRLAGGGTKYVSAAPDAGVDDLKVNNPGGVVETANGIFYLDAQNTLVRIAGGHASVVAGNYVNGFSGDGLPAAQGQFSGATKLAADPAGNIYVADVDNYRIRKIDVATGLMSTIVGNGTRGFSPDGTPVLEASIDGLDSIYWGGDGHLYFMTKAANSNQLLRRIEGGKLVTVAGGSATPVLEARTPFEIAFTGEHYVVQGSDGSLYVIGYDPWLQSAGIILRRIWPDGHVSVVLGLSSNSTDPNEPDARRNCIAGFRGLEIGLDDTLYIAETGGTGCSLRGAGIRAVTPDGQFDALLGNVSLAYDVIPADGPVATARLYRVGRLGRRPDGNLLFFHLSTSNTLHELTVAGGGRQEVPSPDGNEVYTFDAQGRHLKTTSARTGLTVWQFAWTDAGLASITDLDGNVTTVERASGGAATALVAPDGQRTSLELDGNGRVMKVADSEGRAVQASYFDTGLLREWKDENGHVTTFEWDSAGNLAAETNARGAKKELIADTSGVALRSPEGREARFQRHASEGLTVLTNTAADGTQTTRRYLDGSETLATADGTVTQTYYQSGVAARLGGVTELPGEVAVTLPSGLKSSAVFLRVNDGGVQSVSSEVETATINGKTWTSTLDVAGKTRSVKSPLNRVASMTLNDKLRPLTVTQPGLSPVTYAYDARGRVTSVTQGARSQTLTYGTNGALASVTNALNETTYFTTDSTGRVTKVTRADAKEVLQSQDGVGNVTSVTPADSAAHTYSYDEANEVTAYTPPAVTPATQPETTTYDLDGLVTATGHADGTSTTVTRETSGRVSAVVSPWWRNDFTYLPSGQLQTATRGAQTLAWAYDGFLVKTETATGVVSAWSYDSDFRVTSHAINDAGIAYTYDNDSLLTGAGVATLTRSPDSGFLMGVTVGSVATAFGYNGYGEVESVTSGALYSEGLQYDSAGRLTVIQESVNGTPTQYTYTYDSVGRLTSATKDGTQTTSWTYDGNGNRLTENGVTSTFDAQDRLLTKGTTTYTWDALGGRKTKTEGGQTTQYTHDGLGALQSVTLPDSTQVTYEYDARQRRVAKRRNGTLEARWVYDGQYRVAAQLDASGNVTHRFVYGSQSHSPDYVVKGGVTYAYVKNHLGSIRFVVDASTGIVAQQLDYDAWGNVLSDSAPGFQPFAFAGGIYDRDTKLTHFGYRDYDASVGIWTAKDPIQLSGGMNTYVYCNASPVRLVDWSGKTALTAYVSMGFLQVDPEIEGRSPYLVGLTTGRRACMNQATKACQASADQGPTPEGYYEIYSQEMTYGAGPGWLIMRAMLVGDWGSFRVPLHPTQTFPSGEWAGQSWGERKGFYLHGGEKPGSAGCLDIGGGVLGDAATEAVVRDILADPDGYVPLTVWR